MEVAERSATKRQEKADSAKEGRMYGRSIFRIAAVAGWGVIAATIPARAAVFIDGSTQGLYNAGIGTLLNGTNPIVDDNGASTFLFPNNNSNPNDPTVNAPPEPDLSTAATALGNWLTDPANPGGSWSAVPQAIPSTWTINTETAIIYEIDSGTTGLESVSAQFGIDNSIFVWLDGIFQGGQVRPGDVSLGELTLSLGDLTPGPHFLQVLREDHGNPTGYAVQVEGEPLTAVIPVPGAVGLMATALGVLGSLAAYRRRVAHNAL